MEDVLHSCSTRLARQIAALQDENDALQAKLQFNFHHHPWADVLESFVEVLAHAERNLRGA